MKYAHILAAVTEERWAMREEKLQAILDFLEAQANGVKFSAEEIEARATRTAEREVARQQGQVAVLPLHGVIANRVSMLDDFSGGTSSEGFAQKFNAALADDGIKAIIIDIDSPGGAVSGADELSSLIFNARGTKPIIAQVDAMAASAAYWIGTAADEMVVTPSGMIGSIGVYGVHTDLSGALEQDGVKKTLISAGKFKTDGNPFQPLGDDARARMQGRVDEAHDMFIKAVARNRNVSQSAVRDGFGQGDVVTAGPAVSQGMADRVGTMENTLQRFGATKYRAPVKRASSFASEREKRALQHF
jgi:signal peptide peptidase SppA